MNPDDATIVEAMQASHLRRNGVPTEAVAARRRRGMAVAADALHDFLSGAGIVASPLGPEWTERLVAHVDSMPPPEHLRRLGWLPLDTLVHRLGEEVQDCWVVVGDGTVLTAVCVTRSPPGDPVAAILSRCVRRGEVRLAEVLELRECARLEATFPASHPALIVAADIESAFGGRELVRWGAGGRVMPPAELGRRRPAFRLIDVALSGVDGSGKSTLRALVGQQLSQVGVPVSVIWARPGMGMGTVTSVGRWVKRCLGEGPEPGVRAVADQRAASLRSRRGLIGEVWTLLVTVSFLLNARRQRRVAFGVVLWDRHLLDALATLDFAYEGVDLRLSRLLVRRFLPAAASTFYIDIPVEVAASRKPDDTLGEFALRRQLETYRGARGSERPSVVLDGTRSPEVNALAVLTHLLGC